MKRSSKKRVSFNKRLIRVHKIAEPHYSITKRNKIDNSHRAPTNRHRLFKLFLINFYKIHCNINVLSSFIYNEHRVHYLKIIQNNIERYYKVKFRNPKTLKANIMNFVEYNHSKLCTDAKEAYLKYKESKRKLNE